jgi:serine/threonine protein kinase
MQQKRGRVDSPGITLQDENEAKIRSFDQDYALEKKLQSGSYGTVYTTRHNASKTEYAVKVIDRTRLKKKDDENTLQEIKIMKDLKGVQNIVRLIDVYITPKTFHIVQVFAEGGDVFDKLAQRTAYSEKEARELSITLLQTLSDVHRHKICHRDLKPENLLLKGRWDDAAILLADFGFAKYIPDEGLKTRCGTPAFVAPEIVQGLSYNQQVDMWSAGCLIYMLVSGYPPFHDTNHRGLFRKIRAADFAFHKKYWDSVSVDAKQLLSGLLTVDPKARLTSDQALETSWLEVDPLLLSNRDLSGSLAEIKSFNARRKLKSAMTAVFWSVASNFKHDKFSDLMKAVERKDVSSGTVDEAPEEHENHEFRMSLAHKRGFLETYEMGPKIHAGSFATVYECRHKFWKKNFAVKVVKRDGMSATDEAVLHEVAVMKALDHPNIVKVIDFYEEDSHYYIVMELLAGGDVFDRIIDMKMYTEKDARDLAKFLLETALYMHDLVSNLI